MHNFDNQQLKDAVRLEKKEKMLCARVNEFVFTFANRESIEINFLIFWRELALILR